MRDLADGDDAKWHRHEHTGVKHEILDRYLGAWLPILGRNPLLVLLDGFAGRGEYIEGEPGSPKIMFERAAAVADQGRVEKVYLRCAEPDSTNFGILSRVCRGLNHPKILVKQEQQTFAEAATALAEWAEKQNPPPPIFVMADPYGFRGVPLDIIRRLMRTRRVEVLLTFMVRDMNRFLEADHAEAALTEFFGGDGWNDCLSAENRPECLLMRYQQILTSKGIADYAIPFRVYEDERRQVVYYLVHLTNSPKGMRAMKEAMVWQSGDMTFWPVTVRPPDQLGLDVEEQAPFPTLQRHLAQRFRGRSLTFEELMNEDYPDGVWVEKNYRAALRAMEKDDSQSVEITRPRTTPTGRPPSGVQLGDQLAFG